MSITKNILPDYHPYNAPLCPPAAEKALPSQAVVNRVATAVISKQDSSASDKIGSLIASSIMNIIFWPFYLMIQAIALSAYLALGTLSWVGRCFTSESKPPYLHANPSIDREDRILCGDHLIQTKLAHALQHAINQMAEQVNLPFQYLTAPETFHAHAEKGQIGNYSIGVCHAQGRRPTMEDEHLASTFNVEIQGNRFPVQLFGVFDGHGGAQVSRFVKAHLQGELINALKKFNPSGLSEVGIWNALKMACVNLNRKIPRDLADQGSTGTFAMILDGKLWTANVGDSRTILDHGGIPVQLSEDAKPSEDRYLAGIENRNGFVIDCPPPRVNGILAVARSFGDHCLNGAISARPKITRVTLKNIAPGSHLILGCDGIYDVASTVQVAKSVHADRKNSLEALARNIVYSAYQAGSTDNLSALIVKLS